MHEREAIAHLISLVRAEKSGYLVAINAEKIQRFSKDPMMKSIILNSVLPYPDGAGAVLGLKWLHGASSDKVNMPIMALEAADKARLQVFIVGAEEKNHEMAVKVIKSTYPNIDLVGHLHGYQSKDRIISEVLSSKPQIILIAMGSPRQEELATELMALAKSGVAIGCGGALDILSGEIRRAPTFMIENNLEWLYRLCKQPWRLKRQLFLPMFFLRLLVISLRKKITS